MTMSCAILATNVRGVALTTDPPIGALLALRIEACATITEADDLFITPTALTSVLGLYQRFPANSSPGGFITGGLTPADSPPGELITRRTHHLAD